MKYVSKYSICYNNLRKRKHMYFMKHLLGFFFSNRDLKLEDSYFDRDAEKALMAASNSMFTTKTKPSLLLANQVGNMYTPSVYGGLASYLLRWKLVEIDICYCDGIWGCKHNQKHLYAMDDKMLVFSKFHTLHFYAGKHVIDLRWARITTILPTTNKVV